jgi:hypothetical protein
MTAILPKDLVDKATKELEARGRPIPQDRLPKQATANDASVQQVPFDEASLDAAGKQAEEDHAALVELEGSGIIVNPNPPSPMAEETVDERRDRLRRELADLG